MKKYFQSIPFSRLIIYLILAGCLPFFFIGYSYIKEKNAWNQVAHRILSMHTLVECNARKQSMNMAIRKKYAQTDHFYLDHQIESLRFLKKERTALERLMQNPSFTGNEVIEKRYAFLSGEANLLQFVEGTVQSGEDFQETLEKISHPVEVDTQDLKELLSRIENNQPGKPQLLVTDLNLKKKTFTSGNQVFELNLNLLKRELSQCKK